MLGKEQNKNMLSMQITKFHKSGKRRNNKKLIYNTFI